MLSFARWAVASRGVSSARRVLHHLEAVGQDLVADAPDEAVGGEQCGATEPQPPAAMHRAVPGLAATLLPEAQDLTDDQDGEAHLPPVRDPGVDAEEIRREDGRHRLGEALEAVEVIHVERVVERVALGPHVAGLHAAGRAVEARELQQEQVARPRRHEAIDRLASAVVVGIGWVIGIVQQPAFA
jgi:hypothetical protein